MKFYSKPRLALFGSFILAGVLASIFLPRSPSHAQIQPVFVCDVQRGVGGQTTAGSKSFHAVGASFGQGAVGKPITINGAGPGGINLVTTIGGVVGPNDVLLVNAASTTSTTENFAWGTDDTNAILMALSAGGKTELPPRNCGVTQTLPLVSHSYLHGIGGGTFVQTGTDIIWLGQIGGTVISSGDPVTPINSIDLANFTVDGMGAAADDLYLHGVQSSHFSQIYMTNATAHVLNSDASSACAASCGTVNNDFFAIFADGAGYPTITTTASTIAVAFGSVSTSFDTTGNQFYALRLTYINGNGLDCGFADNNNFFGFQAGRKAGGTGVGVFFHSFTSALQFCKANRFFHIDAGLGGITIDNTNATSPPTQNYMFGVATDSGQPVPSNPGNLNDWYMDGFGNFLNPQGSLRPQNIILQGVTVSQLPSCVAGLKGAAYLVTDQATAAAWNGAVTGSGAQTQWVKCNGTSWVQFSPP